MVHLWSDRVRPGPTRRDPIGRGLDSGRGGWLRDDARGEDPRVDPDLPTATAARHAHARWPQIERPPHPTTARGSPTSPPSSDDDHSHSSGCRTSAQPRWTSRSTAPATTTTTEPLPDGRPFGTCRRRPRQSPAASTSATPPPGPPQTPDELTIGPTSSRNVDPVAQCQGRRPLPAARSRSVRRRR